MSAGATHRGALTRRREAVVRPAGALRDRPLDERVPRERGADALALRVRADEARRFDPARAEVDPLLVDTCFCVRAAAIGMRSVV